MLNQLFPRKGATITFAMVYFDWLFEKFNYLSLKTFELKKLNHDTHYEIL